VALFLITPRAGRILQRHAACTPRQTQDQAMGRLHEEGARTTTPMPETEAYRAHEQARESASGSGGSVLGSHEEEVRERYTRLHGRWRCPVERRMGSPHASDVDPEGGSIFRIAPRWRYNR
jgi:hypothetical protein